MKGKASDICPKCKYYLGMTPQGMYSCGKTNDGSELNIDIDVILNCANFEWKDGKVEGKASDICHKCKNGKVVVWEGVSNIECEDPYDGLIREMSCDDNIRCSMFEIRSEKKEPCDKIPLLQHELEMERLRMKIHQLEKEKAAHMKGIKRLKKSNNDLMEENKRLADKNKELKEICHKAEADVTILNSKVEVLDKRNTNQCVMIGERDKEIENLKKMVERRDRWVKELRSDVYTLQNEILKIRDIAQDAYDDTNKD